jgi:hypothetical protein
MECPACPSKRLHQGTELRDFHPLAGHGMNDSKWCCDAARAGHSEERIKRESVTRAG